MIKKNLKTMIITSIVILLPIVVGLLLWDKLPAEMATHFGQNGEANGWSPKPVAVLGMPLFLLVIHWFCVAFTSADPKKQNISDKVFVLIMWLCPVISIAGNGATYMYALDNTINTMPMAMLLLGCIFLVIGNYMPKMKQSYTIGIKIPWALHSEENWNRTHRLGGYMYMLGGVMIIIAGFIQQFWLVPIEFIIAALVPVAYSFVLYKKGI